MTKKYAKLFGTGVLIVVAVSLILSPAGLASSTPPVEVRVQDGGEAMHSALVPLAMESSSTMNVSGFADVLRGFISPVGGLPARGSTLKETRFGTELATFLNDTNAILEKNDATGYIMQLVQDDGGYKDKHDLNSSIEGTYNAFRTLSLLNHTFGTLEIQGIVNYVNSTLVNQTFFTNIVAQNVTTPKTMYQALAMLNHFNVTLPGFNASKAFAYLLDNFFNGDPNALNYELFEHELGAEPFSATYHALHVMSMLNGTMYLRKPFSNSTMTLHAGTLAYGNASSLQYPDLDAMGVNTTNGTFNITFYLPVEHLRDLSEDEFGFSIDANVSVPLNPVGTTSFASMYNHSSGSWFCITNTTFFNDLDADVKTYTFNSGMVNVSDFTVTVNGTRTVELNFFLEDTSSLDLILGIEHLAWNYSAEYCSYLGDVIFPWLVQGFFDIDSTRENYYGIEVLKYINDTTTLDACIGSIVNHTLIFQDKHGWYFISFQSPKPTMEGMFYACSILNTRLFTTNISVSGINENMSAYLAGWAFPDGGFGSAAEVSLKATWESAQMMYDTGFLDTTTRSAILSYVDSCQGMAPYFFDDGNYDVDFMGDTYYAFKTYDLLAGNASDVPYAEIIVNYIIANQDPMGYFFSGWSLDEVFYASMIIAMTGSVTRIKYPDGLTEFVTNLQTYYGGFLIDPYTTDGASVLATRYAISIAKNLDFLQDIQVNEGDLVLGAFDFLRDHQNDHTGAFYDYSNEMLDNITTVENPFTVYQACDALYALSLLHNINTALLNNYISSRVASFNDFSAFNGTGRFNFTSEIMDRVYLYFSSAIFDAGRLIIDIFVDDLTAFPNQRVKVRVDLATPNGHYIEGATVTISKVDFPEEIGIQLSDLQNGSYAGELKAFNSTGQYRLNTSITHENFFGFTRIYILDVLYSFDIEKIRSVANPVCFFTNQLRFSVPVYNMHTGLPHENATLVLQTLDGNTIATLAAEEGTANYCTDIEFSPWMYQYKTYLLRVEGMSTHTETFEVRILVIPLPITLLIAGCIAFVLAFLFFKNRQRRGPRREKIKETRARKGIKRLDAADGKRKSREIMDVTIALPQNEYQVLKKHAEKKGVSIESIVSGVVKDTLLTSRIGTGQQQQNGARAGPAGESLKATTAGAKQAQEKPQESTPDSDTKKTAPKTEPDKKPTQDQEEGK